MARRYGVAIVVVATILAAGTVELSGQTGTVRGRVVRADGPVGVAEVELILRPLGDTIRTDGFRHFVFLDVPPGPVEVDGIAPRFAAAGLPEPARDRGRSSSGGGRGVGVRVRAGG